MQHATCAQDTSQVMYTMTPLHLRWAADQAATSGPGLCHPPQQAPYGATQQSVAGWQTPAFMFQPHGCIQPRAELTDKCAQFILQHVPPRHPRPQQGVLAVEHVLEAAGSNAGCRVCTPQTTYTHTSSAEAWQGGSATVFEGLATGLVTQQKYSVAAMHLRWIVSDQQTGQLAHCV